MLGTDVQASWLPPPLQRFFVSFFFPDGKESQKTKPWSTNKQRSNAKSENAKAQLGEVGKRLLAQVSWNSGRPLPLPKNKIKKIFCGLWLVRGPVIIMEKLPPSSWDITGTSNYEEACGYAVNREHPSILYIVHQQSWLWFEASWFCINWFCSHRSECQQTQDWNWLSRVGRHVDSIHLCFI